ncbi:hypothetical protein ACWEPM_14620 [Streptomyces sp. NPDC004244]
MAQVAREVIHQPVGGLRRGGVGYQACFEMGCGQPGHHIAGDPSEPSTFPYARASA